MVCAAERERKREQEEETEAQAEAKCDCGRGVGRQKVAKCRWAERFRIADSLTEMES